jgi:hypothetical protein
MRELALRTTQFNEKWSIEEREEMMKSSLAPGYLRQYAMEITLTQRQQRVVWVSMAIRGRAPGLMELIEKIANALDAVAIDCQTMEPMDLRNDPEKGLREWSDFRDRVVRERGSRKE